MKTVTGVALLIAAASSLAACEAMYPDFDAEPSDAVQGYRCPPLKGYTPEAMRRAASMVEPGTIVDQMLNDYHLMRKLCPDEV